MRQHVADLRLCKLILPTTLGVDVFNEVVEAGARVSPFFVGDCVLANAYSSCRHCRWCLGDGAQYCWYFTVFTGSYGEYAKIPERIAVAVSTNVPIEKAGAGPSDTAFVWAGTSGLGSVAIEITHLCGERVISSAGSEVTIEALRSRQPDLILIIIGMTS